MPFDPLDSGGDKFRKLPDDAKPSRARRDGRDILEKTIITPVTPTAHTHEESEITDLGSYSAVGHTHVEADITDLAGGWEPQAVSNGEGDDWLVAWNGTFWETVVSLGQ